MKAQFWQKLADNKVVCNICSNKCIISEGQISRCYSRKNVSGEMVLVNYGIVSSIAADPIEKKPLYHFYPGTKVMSVGGWGCNFKCKHCQNWEISQINKERKDFGSESYVSPEKLIQLAKENNCKGVSWTYNEPTIWFEYTLECARLAKEEGLYTAYITNGFIAKEALKEISPYLDAFRVDLKSFDDDFYKNICGVQSAKPVYESTMLAYELGMHIEAVTNIIPTYNDSDDNLKQIADWIVSNLNENIPWHITRFFPFYKLSNIEPTPIGTLDRAYEIGKNAGLNFVYKGNILGESNTYCPACSHIAIERSIAIKVDISNNGRCQNCNYDLNIKI